MTSICNPSTWNDTASSVAASIKFAKSNKSETAGRYHSRHACGPESRQPGCCVAPGLSVSGGNDARGGADLAGEGGQTSRRSPGSVPSNPFPSGNARPAGGKPASWTFSSPPSSEPAAVPPAGDAEGTHASAGTTKPAEASFPWKRRGPGREWTDEEKSAAVRMAQRGFTDREIATELNRPLPATSFQLKKLRDEGADIPARFAGRKSKDLSQRNKAAAPVPPVPSTDDIEEFIRTRGVTRLPAAFVGASTAHLSAADRAALAARPDPDPVFTALTAPLRRGNEALAAKRASWKQQNNQGDKNAR